MIEDVVKVARECEDPLEIARKHLGREPKTLGQVLGALAVEAGQPRCGNTCDCDYFGQKCHLPGSGVDQYYETPADFKGGCSASMSVDIL